MATKQTVFDFKEQKISFLIFSSLKTNTINVYYLHGSKDI